MDAKRINHSYRKAICYTLIPLIIAFYGIIVAGCVSNSPGISNLFMLSLLTSTQPDSVQLRVGYFGMCAGNVQAGFKCVSTGTSSVTETVTNLALTTSSGSEQIVSFGLDLQRKILPPLIVGAGVMFLFGTAVLSLLKIRQAKIKGGSRSGKNRLRFFALGSIWISAATAFAATMSIAAGASSIVVFTTAFPGSFLVKEGKAVEVIQWLIATFSVIFAIVAGDLALSSNGSAVLPIAKPVASPMDGPPLKKTKPSLL